MSKKKPKTLKQWNEEQVLDLVKLIVEHGPNIAVVTRKHNELHDAKRTEQAVHQQYRRLREIFTYTTYQQAWELMHTNRELFTKPEPKVSKSEQRIAQLERQLKELQLALNEKARPYYKHPEPQQDLGMQVLEEFCGV